VAWQTGHLWSPPIVGVIRRVENRADSLLGLPPIA
jgi:hypothetical protein